MGQHSLPKAQRYLSEVNLIGNYTLDQGTEFTIGVVQECSLLLFYLVHKRAKCDFLEVARGSCAGHESLPSMHITRGQVVGVLAVVRVMTIIGEEERLDDRSVDHCGDYGETRGIFNTRCLIHQKLRLLVNPEKGEVNSTEGSLRPTWHNKVPYTQNETLQLLTASYGYSVAIISRLEANVFT